MSFQLSLIRFMGGHHQNVRTHTRLIQELTFEAVRSSMMMNPCQCQNRWWHSLADLISFFPSLALSYAPLNWIRSFSYISLISFQMNLHSITGKDLSRIRCGTHNQCPSAQLSIFFEHTEASLGTWDADCSTWP